MNPLEAATVVCECCDLDASRKLSSPIINAYGLNRGWRCRKCNEHQGKPIQMAQDHEDDVRVRWGQTVDDWHAAEDRADTGRDKMLAAFKSRDNIVRQFEKLSRYHHATDHGCICGKRNCETLNIVDADWINDHIARMHDREAM
jgi:hypothetical protein